MLLIASCYSDAELMKRTEELARQAEWSNVELMAAFLRKDTKACFDLLVRKKRYPEVEKKREWHVGGFFREHVRAGAAERSGGTVEGGHAEKRELDEGGELVGSDDANSWGVCCEENEAWSSMHSFGNRRLSILNVDCFRVVGGSHLIEEWNHFSFFPYFCTE